jgi:hypothetical protein
MTYYITVQRDNAWQFVAMRPRNCVISWSWDLPRLRKYGSVQLLSIRLWGVLLNYLSTGRTLPLSPLSSDLLKNLSVAQLLKNCPAFYESQKFITVFTRALHVFLFWTRWIQSISLSYFNSLPRNSITTIINLLLNKTPSCVYKGCSFACLLYVSETLSAH